MARFIIAKYPITNAQYDAFVADGGYGEKWRECWTQAGWEWKGGESGPAKQGGVFDLPNHPAVLITWYEAVAYCNWLSAKLGHAVALPSEAQWGRVARHTDGRKYPWIGAEISPNYANYDQTGIGTTTAVGIFPQGASECGALDMNGNVWEWCTTKWRDNYKTAPDEDVEGDIRRVVRGGSYSDSAGDVRCAVRSFYNPNFRYGLLGFRVVVASPNHS